MLWCQRLSLTLDVQASWPALAFACLPSAVPTAPFACSHAAQDHLLALAVGPVGTPEQQLLWMLCLLERKQPPGQMQRDVAAMMAAAGQKEFGRPLKLRFPTGLSLVVRVSLERLDERLGGSGWWQRLDGGPEAAQRLRGQPLELSDPVAAVQVAALVVTDAWLVTSGGEVLAYEHGCQLGDAMFAFDQVRKMGAIDYAE